jgi:hypothetical protein
LSLFSEYGPSLIFYFLNWASIFLCLFLFFYYFNELGPYFSGLVNFFFLFLLLFSIGPSPRISHTRDTSVFFTVALQDSCVMVPLMIQAFIQKSLIHLHVTEFANYSEVDTHVTHSFTEHTHISSIINLQKKIEILK